MAAPHSSGGARGAKARTPFPVPYGYNPLNNRDLPTHGFLGIGMVLVIVLVLVPQNPCGPSSSPL